MTLTREQRQEVLLAVAEVFERRFYDPKLHEVDLAAALRQRSDDLLAAPDFSREVVSILRNEVRAYPLDFFHDSERVVPLGRILGATFHRAEVNGCTWMFQDILIGQAAAQACVKPGALLLDTYGRGSSTTEDLLVRPGAMSVQFKNPGSASNQSLAVEDPRSSHAKKRKPATPLEYREAAPGVGYIRISNFPGILGIDIARETDRAFRGLRRCDRMVIDIRGNTGSAGAGNLRLMSYFTSSKIPVGYSLTRPRAERGYRREELARFERIPAMKILAPFTLWRFRKVDKSIVVVTEGLGAKSFHGRIVLLVNEHTVSGAEIIAGFASDHRLAVVVGTRTAGKLLAFATRPVGHGYFLTLPIGNYLTWEGKSFEGVGVAPDVDVPFCAEQARQGIDNQLAKAIEVAQSL
jgi:carboxyl-terminal processing protease